MMSLSSPLLLLRSGTRTATWRLASAPGAPCLRSASTLQAPSAAPSTFSSAIIRTSRPALASSRPTLSPSSSITFTKRRSASTSTSTTTTTTTTTPLTWNRFLALRKTRRRISLGSSVVCAGGVAAIGLSSIMASDFDSTAAATTGFDPIAILGLSSAGLLALGWLLGPAFGNAVFGVLYRGQRGAIEAKEREFFTRIRKHRVDPTNSSIQNPVPDYYGEKIGSVAGYRQWLKDQRAFNLKRGKEV